MSHDPVASKVANRFFSALQRVFDTVTVKNADGSEQEYEVVKRYQHFVVHAMTGGRGYCVVHAPTGQTIRTDITSRKVADGMAKYLGIGDGQPIFQKAARGDIASRVALDAILVDFKPTPGPAKRLMNKGAAKGPTFPFEAAAGGNHVTRTFKSMEAALRAAIEFRRDHAGDSDYDWLRITRRASTKSAPEHLITLRGTDEGWRILASALTDAPKHLLSELLDQDDED